MQWLRMIPSEGCRKSLKEVRRYYGSVGEPIDIPDPIRDGEEEEGREEDVDEDEEDSDEYHEMLLREPPILSSDNDIYRNPG